MSSTTMPTLPTEILAKIFSDPKLTMDDLERCEEAARGSRAFTAIVHTFGRYALDVKFDRNGVATTDSVARWIDLLGRDRFRVVKQLSAVETSMYDWFSDDRSGAEDHMLQEYSLNSSLKPALFRLNSLALRLTTPAQRFFDLIAGSSASTLQHLSLPLMRAAPSDPNLITDLSKYEALSTFSLSIPAGLHRAPTVGNVHSFTDVASLLATLPNSHQPRQLKIFTLIETFSRRFRPASTN
ncbi:hypothetical protein MNV49_001369 [Pseudohyphozyma bogoriensis]|nr:hypothetical protein MNV49_001369 [Pseudohyphozyma bogoriensis]